MLRTNVYLTEQQNREIQIRAALSKKPKAQVLREVVDEGLKHSPKLKSTSIDAFIKLGEIAEQFRGKGKGPKDLSVNIDKYLWDRWEG